MKSQWIAMEHYRMHSVEQWPDGPKKDGALAAIRSSLASLSKDAAAAAIHDCLVCQGRRREDNVLEFASHRAAA